MTRRARPRVWSVAEAAEHLFGVRTPATCTRARRWLLRLQVQRPDVRFLEGAGGRRYTIVVAALARVSPDLVASVEPLDARVERLEDELTELRANTRRIVMQVGANTRDLQRLRERTTTKGERR